MGYRPDIDGLRAVAVVAIVAFHASPFQVTGGFVGVDVFFVISGFLIGGIVLDSTARGDFSFLLFYTRRIRRIFPALILVLAATWAIGIAVLLPDELAALGGEIAAAALFGANVLFWMQAGYFDSAAESKPLLHLWSLGVEEQFYIAFPLLTAVLGRWPRLLLPGLALIAVASFAACLALTPSYPSAAFYLPPTRAWQFLAGVLLVAANRGSGGAWSQSAKHTASIAGLGLIAAAVMALEPQAPYPSWRAAVPTAGAVLIIAAGPAAIVNRLLANRAAVTIGLISYPLYLWHWPLLTIARILEGGDFPSRTVRFGLVGISFVLAWLTWRLLERPLRARPAPRVAVPLTALALAAVACGFVTLQTGFADRFPPDVRSMAQTKAAYLDTVRTLWRDGRCYLEANAPSYAAECVPAEPPGQPLLALWGDSHGAALFPGLLKIGSERGFRVAQFTASACAPIIGVDVVGRPNCRALNDAALAAIRAAAPLAVVLHADWSLRRYDLDRLPATIGMLKAAGVKRIVLLGSVPHWRPDLPKLLIAEIRQGTRSERMPIAAWEPVLVRTDTRLRVIAETSGALFIPALERFCDSAGCLTRVPGSAEPTAFDQAHLTPTAARYLAEAITPRLLQR